MKISQINILAGSTLLLVVSAMAGLMLWSLDRLNTSFDRTRSYQQLQVQINTEVSLPILTYLSSGNASLLSEIDSALSRLINEESQAKKAIIDESPSVEKTLIELQTVALLKLRAAGKLRQPQELLINNEREILASVSLLTDYVLAGGSQRPALQQQYSSLLTQINLAIPELAHSRQHYFSAAQPNRSDIDQRLTNLATLGQQLEALPRFNLFEERENNDALSTLLGNAITEATVAPDEQGDLYTHELNSLIKRYAKELLNIEKIYARRADSIANTTELIDQLNGHLQGNQDRLQKNYDATGQLVNLLLLISLSLITFIGLIMCLLSTRLSNIISRTCKQLDALANGQLNSQTSKPSRILEMTILNDSINRLRNYFSVLIEKINTESNALDRLGKNLNNSSDTLTQIVKQQQSSTEHTSVQIEQLSCSYQEVAENAVKTSQATRQATEIAIQGVTEMHNTSASIQQLEAEADATHQTLEQLKDDGKEIGAALHVIHNFAEQTNLLALNAAIEAARAGDSGRGFAVVANEVRSLAVNTAKAADNINAIIKKLNGAIDQMANKIERQAQHVSNTVLLADNARQSVEQIQLSINEIDSMSSMIASATEEQSAVTNQISEGINMTLIHSQESAREAHNNKQQAHQLDLTSNSLMQLLKQFSQKP